MIGFNPTPELKNYSRIIIKHIKAILIKPNLKTQNTKKLTKSFTVAKFRVEIVPFESK